MNDFPPPITVTGPADDDPAGERGGAGGGLRCCPLTGLPEITEGDALIPLVIEAMARAGLEPEDGDCLAICQKVVSKSEGRVARLDELKPSRIARAWALANDRDPREIQAVVAEARRMVRTGASVLITETHHGFVCANSGVDLSNAPPDSLCLLPEDPDASAARLRAEIRAATGRRIAVLITDTWGRPFRLGAVDVAIGMAGLPALLDHRGASDAAGRELTASALALPDAVAAAAGLVMGKVRRIPAVVVRGLPEAASPPDGETTEEGESNGDGGNDRRDDRAGAAALLRDAGEDLFR